MSKRLLTWIMRRRLRLLNNIHKTLWVNYGSKHPETIHIRQRWLGVATRLIVLHEERPHEN